MNVETHNKQRNDVEYGVVAGLLSVDADGSLHHGVLPHQNHGIASQTLPDVLELSRTDVVGERHQNLSVLIDELAEPLIVGDLLVAL